MGDVINIDSKGRQTNLSQPGKPVTQGAIPSTPDEVLNTHITFNRTKNRILLEGNIYTISLVGSADKNTL